ncbi:MAG TPA: RNase adapter RapZ [Drouetiella sp.]
MSSKSTRQLESKASSGKDEGLKILITSFGYKQGPPPLANIVFDVRFLKNPYWVEELRPLTGRDVPVQQYVLEQELAQDFLVTLKDLLAKILPKMAEMKVEQFVIAFGCTGGQHRSTTLVEKLADELASAYPDYKIIKQHRELDKLSDDQDGDCGDTKYGAKPE